MKPLAGLPSTVSVAGELAADSRSLERLKREAKGDPKQAIKAAARQFESMFMQMVLKSMREATPKSGLFDSSAGDLYSGMLDQQLAGAVSGGSGLAAIIERQLSRHMQAMVPAAATDHTVGRKSPATDDAGAEAMAARPRSTLGPAQRPIPAAVMADGASAPSTSARAAPDLGTRTSSGVGGATAQSVFVNRMWDHALVAQRDTGLPAKFIIGQAALESGWGSREITGSDGLRSFNLFGIKATGGWQGRTVEAATTEYENGVPVRKVEKFRAYNSYGEAFRDWARLLTANPRYAEVLSNRTDAAGFANGLQRAGYATDPNYGAKLRQVIETAQALRRMG